MQQVTKEQLEERVDELEDALEEIADLIDGKRIDEARDLIDDVLGVEDEDEAAEDSH